MDVTAITRSVRTRLALSLCATFALGLPTTGAATAAVTPGPAGNLFYSQAVIFPTTGKHGQLIRYRAAQAGTALPDAAKSWAVLYRSQTLSGHATAVSGNVWIPKGSPPSGGWPLVSWAHGTTGAADICAPSKATDNRYDSATLDRWLKAGYAIAATDYEGLGTPGVHPYLLGHSEGRGVIDIAAAAHQLPGGSSISQKWIASGHSQGGHAALYAAADAATWTLSGADTHLVLKGVAAFAPANTMKTAVLFAKGAIHSANPISGLGALIVRSITLADPGITLSSLMAPAPYALRGQFETKCSPDLAKTDSFGQFAPSALLTSWTNTTAQRALGDLAKDAISPNSLRIKVPTLVLQGLADGTVLPNLTKDFLVPSLKALGDTGVILKTYAGVDHGGIVASGGQTTGWTPSSAWIFTQGWLGTTFSH